jgi:hypothetical protein
VPNTPRPRPRLMNNIKNLCDDDSEAPVRTDCDSISEYGRVSSYLLGRADGAPSGCARPTIAARGPSSFWVPGRKRQAALGRARQRDVDQLPHLQARPPSGRSSSGPHSSNVAIASSSFWGHFFALPRYAAARADSRCDTRAPAPLRSDHRRPRRARPTVSAVCSGGASGWPT